MAHYRPGSFRPWPAYLLARSLRRTQVRFGRSLRGRSAAPVDVTRALCSPTEPTVGATSLRPYLELRVRLEIGLGYIAGPVTGAGGATTFLENPGLDAIWPIECRQDLGDAAAATTRTRSIAACRTVSHRYRVARSAAARTHCALVALVTRSPGYDCRVLTSSACAGIDGAFFAVRTIIRTLAFGQAAGSPPHQQSQRHQPFRQSPPFLRCQLRRRFHPRPRCHCIRPKARRPVPVCKSNSLCSA